MAPSSRPVRTVPVYLSVYDLSPNNSFLYGWGLGAYHSGVVVNGREYTFGGGDASGTGVFSHEPKGASGCTFREQVLLGEVPLTSRDVDAALSELRPLFLASDYHVLRRNCNCFSDALARRLTGRGIPGWVNRMAAWGSCCSCCMPGMDDAQTPSVESVPLVPQRTFLTGKGNSLGSSSSSSSSSARAVSAEERRQRARDAALARLHTRSDE